jgi:acyl-CoA thioesterase-1
VTRIRLLSLATLAATLIVSWGVSPLRSASARHDLTNEARTSRPRAVSASYSGQSVYVAIGASDTVGYGVQNPSVQGWVPRFATSLPHGWKTVNLGVVGFTVHQALLVDLPVALDAHPQLVTVWLAVNDLLGYVSLATYRQDLHSLLNGLQKSTRARVLVGNIPDLTRNPRLAARLGPNSAQTLFSWNAAIRDEARASGATLVDLFASWQELALHPEYVGADGLHPSADGYKRIAEIFRAAL